MNKSRPINLKLSTIHFPITAISSILHRISGVIILFLFGIFLWLLDLSLSSQENFQYVMSFFNNIYFKFIVWNILTVFIYHIVNGIRHVLMDFRFLSETLKSGVLSSYIVFVISIILSILAGVFIW
ncbi:succinate dehydrogenase, cytochrome b556 subunit [Candidatus Pantoea edessiphila]|uniref:Succinate dehydrogenase cytochrome b556 subunit n=1 Tax=Candidatus Pantoea edessiphila TaxID=2044610 RepID=A0A2P5SZ13_9GAMM|nr:succinate dehydrogenase, cytochrome b556 subunit [Candidatus Pantoea edessiphila]MBK4775296.1 succinate dehydrogenase, cytochrome b556 subunit [Pantoea sp. Edef]PPI87566.1 succinate dehydrogenase, cytochrome b556 subunit [Candidatus Pantoea edessiphila]